MQKTTTTVKYVGPTLIQVELKDIRDARDSLIALSSLAEAVADERDVDGKHGVGTMRYIEGRLSKIAADLSEYLTDIDHSDLPF